MLKHQIASAEDDYPNSSPVVVGLPYRDSKTIAQFVEQQIKRLEFDEKH